MNKIHVIRNRDIQNILIGTPNGHQHLRVCVKLKQGSTLIFQEATIANLLRAYVTIKTHPKIRAGKLEAETLTENQRKEGYAEHQLLETVAENGEVEEEISKLLEKGAI
ncbi:MAG: hypothetical protein U9O89_02215 [Thermoproteota archaeon]|nr:hypothetical protein [Thermoproteota archaeon]